MGSLSGDGRYCNNVELSDNGKGIRVQNLSIRRGILNFGCWQPSSVM